MSLIRLSESSNQEGDSWFIDYDKDRGMYRASYFQDNHFVDECWFDAYEDRECDDRVRQIINKLINLKLGFATKCKHKYLDVKGIEYFIDKLINYIKEL
jgi:hypothetical protein